MDTVQQTQLLNNIAIVLAVTAITFLIVAVVLWFVFDIAHSIRVLTRIGTNKKVAITKTPGVQKSDDSYERPNINDAYVVRNTGTYFKQRKTAKGSIADICWVVSDFYRDQYNFYSAVFYQKLALEQEL